MCKFHVPSIYITDNNFFFTCLNNPIVG
ncbi:hypothetical protein Goari_023452 [Gossypium aridum]|uniref:Uncharacterized protein n=1 Tax=Gossypium aridum TaxID=34290 RepID=A0A7J8X314_GOSAI|nr:hypothetical protein [Gossypium aridum]